MMLKERLEEFVDSPADSAFQSGYLAALIDMAGNTLIQLVGRPHAVLLLSQVAGKMPNKKEAIETKLAKMLV
jgi:hypothetical protein